MGRKARSLKGNLKEGGVLMRKALVVLAVLVFAVAFCETVLLHESLTFTIYRSGNIVVGYFHGFWENLLSDDYLCFFAAAYDTKLYLELCLFAITFEDARIPEKFRNLTAIVVGKERFPLNPSPFNLGGNTVVWHVEGGGRILDVIAGMDYVFLEVYSGYTRVLVLTVSPRDFQSFLEEYRYQVERHKKFGGR